MARIPESDLRRFARLAAPLLQGTAASGYGPRAAHNRAGRGLEFLDTRPYQHGDELRTVDWRQSARAGKLVIRRYRDETAADWFICVDGSESVRMGGRKWTLSSQLATALAYTLLFAGHRVALLLFSDRINGFCALGRGPHHFAALLATVEAAPAGAASRRDSNSNLGLCTPHITQNSNVFVLSDFLVPDGMRADLRAIRARAATTSALQVLDRGELDVPTRGATMLVDAESGEARRLAVSDNVIEYAEAALRAHCDKLATSCAGLGIRFSGATSEAAWHKVLLEHLRPHATA